MSESCIFCNIIHGVIPSAIIYEDRHVISFLDIAPITRGHTLVVPRIHAPNLLEESPRNFEGVLPAIQKIGQALILALKADGLNILNNSLPVAGQVVFHTHFHLIPRFAGDGLHHWPQGTYQPGEIDTTRERILKVLAPEIL